MFFFFDYIYYRVTQLLFKRDGRTGGTAIALISLTQTFMIALPLLPLSHYLVPPEVMHQYAKINGYIGAGIAFVLLILNYRKYDGTYNKYRYHWRDETKLTRFVKGIFVILSLFLPMIVVMILGVKQ